MKTKKYVSHANKDLQTIMENFRRFTAKQNITMPSAEVCDKIYLFENKKRKTGSWSKLIKEHKRGKISGTKMIKIFEASLEYELNNLDEGVMDYLQKGADWIYKKGKELPAKIEKLYNAAMEKFSNLFFAAMTKVIEFAIQAKNAIMTIGKMLMGVWSKFSKWCKKHPIICKVIKILIFMVICFVIASFAQEAQAGVEGIKSVDNPGNIGGGSDKLSDTAYKGLRGMIEILGEHAPDDVSKVDVALQTGEAIAELDKAMQSANDVDINKLSSITRAAFQSLSELNAEYKAGDGSAGEMLQRAIKMGAQMKVGGVSGADIVGP